MNAYELAKAQQAYSALTLEEIIKQQADRIAELEKCLFQMQNACVYLTKPSAEPFIWLKQDFDGEWIEVHPNKGIPLYTTPQIKELSADEIHEVAKKFLTSYDLEIDQGLYGDTSRVLIAIKDWYGFARAILKKASEN
jgi:hypothetical protein